MSEIVTNCGNCRFSFADGQVLVCRRHPPQVTFVPGTAVTAPAAVAAWPQVVAHQWCGEHKLKTAAMQTEGNITRLPRTEDDGA